MNRERKKKTKSRTQEVPQLFQLALQKGWRRGIKRIYNVRWSHPRSPKCFCGWSVLGHSAPFASAFTQLLWWNQKLYKLILISSFLQLCNCQREWEESVGVLLHHGREQHLFTPSCSHPQHLINTLIRSSLRAAHKPSWKEPNKTKDEDIACSTFPCSLVVKVIF